jgi:hypothetical protein
MIVDQIDDIYDNELDSSYDELDILLVNQNLSELSNTEIRIRLLLMKANFDLASHERGYLDDVYKNEIKNKKKRKFLKSILFDNNWNKISNNKSHMIKNKRERSSDKNLKNFSPSGKRGCLFNSTLVTSPNFDKIINEPLSNSKYHIENSGYKSINNSFKNSKSSLKISKNPKLIPKEEIINYICSKNMNNNQVIKEKDILTFQSKNTHVIEIFVSLGFLIFAYIIYNKIDLIRLVLSKLENNQELIVILTFVGIITLIFIIFSIENKIESQDDVYDEEYKKILEERARAWEKHLEKQKYKNISIKSQIGNYFSNIYY